MFKHYYIPIISIQIQINSAIDGLIKEEFSNESVFHFKEVMCKILSYDIPTEVSSSLSQKLQEISRLITAEDTNQRVIFRKVLQSLLMIDASILNNLETKFLSKKYFDSFIILLEEKIKHHSFIEETCLSFIKVIYEEHFTILQISTFLKTLDKNHGWLMKQLLLLNDFRAIKEVLRLMFQQQENYSQELGESIESLIDFRYSSITLKQEYLDLVLFVLENTYDYHESMMGNKWLSYIDIEKELIRNTTFRATVNYSKYLYAQDPELYYSFEANVIIMSSGHWLIQVAKTLPFSSKNKILVRLSQGKNNAAIKLFMDEFPEFKHLAPFV